MGRRKEVFEYYFEKYGIYYLAYMYLGKISYFKSYSQYKCTELIKKRYGKMNETEKKLELQDFYKFNTGKTMDIDNPRDFNEKIQWLKIHDVTEKKTMLADKYGAREYIRDIAGDDHLVKLYGVYDSVSDIDFDKLPESYVIKCTQGCGFNVIKKPGEKINKKSVIRNLKWWLKTDYAYWGYELQYDIKNAKIIVEEYIEGELEEYKFLCFEGEPKMFWIRSSENSRLTRNYFDMHRKPLNIEFGNVPLKKSLHEIEETEFKELVDIVRKLSQGFKMVRVDTFVIGNKFYIGELTFNTGSGFDTWRPKEQEEWLGRLIKIHNE